MRTKFISILAAALSMAAVACSPVEVASVSINEGDQTLTVGDKVTLTATILPADAANTVVEWKSSDESVAKIDASGNLEAVAEGEATITVTAGAKSDFCTVTVEPDAFVFVPDMADSGYSARVYFNSSYEEILDEGIIWLRSSDYTLEKGASFGEIIQTGEELQLCLLLPLDCGRGAIPEGKYEIFESVPADDRKPMTSLSYYTYDKMEFGTFYANYDTGEYFKPVSGEIELTRSTTVQDEWLVKCSMSDAEGEAFRCEWQGKLEFRKRSDGKYF